MRSTSWATTRSLNLETRFGVSRGFPFSCVVVADHPVCRRDVEEANEKAPAFSRIFKEMILVTSKAKPMLRTGKGTVMKKAMMKLYESEIDAL